MRRTAFLFFCTVLFLTGGIERIFALDVTITPPRTGNAVANGIIDGEIPAVKSSTIDELDKFGEQTELARGFADANTYTSAIASQRSRPDISTFAVTVGTMIGAQFPELDYSGMIYNPESITNAFSDLEQEGDAYLGLSWQIWSAHVQINSGFLLEGLTLGLKFGKLAIDYDDFSLDEFNIGATAFYKLVDVQNLLFLIKWNGVTVGSGLIYQSSSTTYNTSLDQIESASFVTPLGPAGTIVVDPSIQIGLEVSTVSIPLEIYTGLQLLWVLNLTVGAGVDLAFGSSEIILGAVGDVGLGGDLVDDMTEPGSITVDGGTSGVGPSFMKPRIMAALGLTLGPALIEVPITYYFGYGLSAGVNVSFVW
jgi:hypothetical protein